MKIDASVENKIKWMGKLDLWQTIGECTSYETTNDRLLIKAPKERNRRATANVRKYKI